MPEPATESQSGPSHTRRLVIRVKIVSKGPSEAPVRRRSNRGVLLLILGIVAVGLSWVGISVFRTEPASTPAASEGAPSSESQSRASAPPSPISEVIPEVPRSAQKTIRGTVRVSVRVIVDKKGSVLAATADDPGPSRYFERLAIQASKKWTFAPTDSEEQRIMRVRFSFTRAGTTARANSLQ